MQKYAIITGITGQDGSYLAEYLLNKDYHVFGSVRKSSSNSMERLDPIKDNPNLQLINMDFLDTGSIDNFVHTVYNKCKPSLCISEDLEVYNLAAQSHVGESFKIPSITHQINAVGVIILLESLRNYFKDRFRFYQASTSELFGNTGSKKNIILNETAPFSPTSPYAIAKASAFYTVKNYRKAYDLYCVNGILFNHESPRRGKEFVTRKITLGIAEYASGKNTSPIQLGNIYAQRDWGDAREYVKTMHLMLTKQEVMDGILNKYHEVTDFVVATGETRTVKDFCELAFNKIGVGLEWIGRGVNEKAINLNNKEETLIEVNKEFYRPSDIHYLLGDASLIKEKLKWKYQNTFKDLVDDMVESDLLNVSV
jgi:GDPmannose 4,6-dehydratase|tara:strand:+ start:1536 stop:2639 length:1104 start_codon:yes stop_codon:yes gene_type:complete